MRQRKLMSVNISETTAILSILDKLEDSHLPVFGKMSPQHMIEHISAIVLYSNGRRSVPLLFSEEKAAKFKAYLIDTDNEFPVGFRAPLIGEDLLPLRFVNLDAAKSILMKEVNRYHEYWEQNKDGKMMHPTLGILDHREWTIFHNKHFTHHFNQFNLL